MNTNSPSAPQAAPVVDARLLTAREAVPSLLSMLASRHAEWPQPSPDLATLDLALHAISKTCGSLDRALRARNAETS